MKLVKRVLPNGRVQFTRTFYLVSVALAAGLVVACLGLVATALSL